MRDARQEWTVRQSSCYDTHHYIHTSKALDGELEDIPLLRVVRHVACDGVRLTSPAHDLVRDVLRACAVSITDDYLRTSWGRA